GGLSGAGEHDEAKLPAVVLGESEGFQHRVCPQSKRWTDALGPGRWSSRVVVGNYGRWRDADGLEVVVEVVVLVVLVILVVEVVVILVVIFVVEEVDIPVVVLFVLVVEVVLVFQRQAGEMAGVEAVNELPDVGRQGVLGRCLVRPDARAREGGAAV